MMNTFPPKAGVLGGLGPQATADFYLAVIEEHLLLAQRQQATRSRPEIAIESVSLDPVVENSFIAGGDERDEYLPPLREAARRLLRADCSFIVMPCNTAHEFFPEIQAWVPIQVVNLIELVAAQVQIEGWKRILLLATKRTVQSRMYQRAMAVRGVSVVLPTENEQRRLTVEIEGRLAEPTRVPMRLPIEELSSSGPVDGVVLGCTDLHSRAPIPGTVDSLTVLARHAAKLLLRP